MVGKHRGVVERIIFFHDLSDLDLTFHEMAELCDLSGMYIV